MKWLFAVPVLYVAHAVPVGSLPESISRIRQEAREPTDRIRLINQLFDRSLRDRLNDTSVLTAAELHDLFGAMSMAAQLAAVSDYTRRSIYLEAMGTALEELNRRGGAERREVESYYQQLIRMRSFSRISPFAEAYMRADLMSHNAFELSGEDEKTVMGYAIDRDGKLAPSVTAPPARGGYVVIVVGCHFAEDAALALLADSRFRTALEGRRVFWLFSQGELDTAALQAWNQQFPSIPALIAYDNARWRGVDFSSTPSFNYFLDGQLVSMSQGWDAEDGVGEVLMSLAAIGLVPR
jgi:hypothetical protein